MCTILLLSESIYSTCQTLKYLYIVPCVQVNLIYDENRMVMVAKDETPEELEEKRDSIIR